MKKTNTLIASFVAIALCFTMLLGTTFAWFTDSVINTNTILTSGNIDVELWHCNDSKSDNGYGFGYNANNAEEVNGSTKLFLNVNGEDILWEPGAEVGENFRIKNVGSLALKYQFTIKALSKTTTVDGKALTDVIKLQAVELEFDENGVPVGSGLYEEDINFANGYVISGDLLAGDYHISLDWLSTENDNDYKNLKILLGVELVATQFSYESDGLGTGFDDGVAFPNVSYDVNLENDLQADGSALLQTKGEKGVSATIPSSVVDTLKNSGIESLSLVHTAPIEEEGKVTFESIEFVDKNGNIVNLENYQLEEKIEVTLPAQNTFSEGEQVLIYHDGKEVGVGIVNEQGEITYEVEHFCEVVVSYYSEKITENNGIYEIGKLSQLINFQEQVNNGNTFKKSTVVLTNDIDLSCIANWKPIGNSENSFQGTFDGQNHTIKNLNCVMEGKSNIGLFGMTVNGEIKNLTVENAIITGRLNVGVVAGTPYTSKYTNVSVTGHVEVNGMSYVGGVGGKNAYANWTNITINVDETSYVNANSIENGTAYRTYVGGVVGFMGEGGHTFENVTSNINVSGSTCDVGGITGIAHYGNTFSNCVSTGNVEITNANEANDAEEMGGIAGVWHNGGANVTFTNCSFTGKLEANLTEGVDLSNNTITGKPYSESGKGKLIINDAVVVYTADGLIEALENNKNVMFANDIKIDPANMSNAYGTTGINIKNGQTIDGAGYTLDIKGAGGTWDSGINTTGGVIKNITVTGSFRGIFINHNSTHSEQVVLENVIIKGTTYTISCDQGTNQGFKATNCELWGWTSFAATLGNAEFVNCTFGEGNGYAYCRPYAPTTFTGCTFEAGFEMDTRAAVTLENCTIGGEALTSENLSLLVTSNISNATIK